jgi:hypothetical protein
MAGRFSVAAFAVLVVVGAAGCSSGAPSGPPLVLTGAVGVGGYPALGGGPEGVTLRFIDRGRFGVGLALRNRSRRSVTILDARVLEPPRTLIHQVGTRLVSWNPPPCPSRVRGCILRDFFRPSYGAVRPLPVTAAPGKQVGAQLNFRLGSCRAVPLASPAAPRFLLVDYRYGQGALRRQTLPLGSARLRLRMPQPGDCAHRPHSKISVDGSYGTSSDWTVPGSDGDSCRRTPTGALRFRSRLYQFPRRPTVRVAIRLPRFRGRGTYYRAQVHVVVSTGGRGWTVLRAEGSLVTVTHAGRTTFGGRFRARLTDRLGAPFRAYGAWRCTTRWK